MGQVHHRRATTAAVGRLNRTIKGATVKRLRYDNHGHHRWHLVDFVAAHNVAQQLKTLRGVTPYEAHLQSLGGKHPILHYGPAPPISGTMHQIQRERPYGRVCCASCATSSENPLEKLSFM